MSLPVPKRLLRLSTADRRTLDDAFEMHGGWVLDFNDRTMAEWFELTLGLDLEQPQYRREGDSKAKRLRTFVSLDPPQVVARALRALWRYRVGEAMPSFVKADPAEETGIRDRLFALIARLEGETDVVSSDAIEAFEPDQTLSELVDAIRRDLDADRPAAGLDRLHTYCMKRLMHLLRAQGVPCGRDEPLHSRMGKYIRALEGEAKLTEMTLLMLRSNIQVFDRFNAVRNNHSLAHDNSLIARAEARYIFEAVSATLRFIKAIDAAYEEEEAR